MLVLLHGLCEEGNSVDEAVELLRGIVDRGDPSAHFCKTGNPQKTIETFKEMREIGIVRPFVECFNSILDDLCKERRIDEALALLQDMYGQRRCSS